MGLVLDASIVLAWLFPDEDTQRAEALVAGLATAPAQAPSLIRLEIANALLQAQRRGRISRDMRIALFDAFSDLPIALDTADDTAVIRAAELADRHGLSAYDGAYLELASRRRFPIGTLDQALARAARQEGIDVLPAA